MSGKVPFQPVSSEQYQDCGGEVRPKGPKLEARRAQLEERGLTWRGGLLSPSSPARGLREHCELSQWGLGQSPAAKNFVAFEFFR